jgi:hypothetical protein
MAKKPSMKKAMEESERSPEDKAADAKGAKKELAKDKKAAAKAHPAAKKGKR